MQANMYKKILLYFWHSFVVSRICCMYILCFRLQGPVWEFYIMSFNIYLVKLHNYDP